jgi:glycosyltransferase involved in cell wall biosynthesis
MLPRIGHRHRSILTVSKFARTRLLHYRIAPAEAIHVIHNGVDHVRQVAPDRATARAKGLIPGRYVLALASTQSHKNIALLTRAFADPALADITLALVGGASVTRISPEASANVTSLGQVSDSALFGLMADALAWACPSLTEGFGLPPLEAMALGAPVIAAPRGALPEVLGAAPLWAAVDDPAEWVRHILHLATDHTEASRRSELGRRHAARFTWAASGEALLTLLGSERHEAAPCAA